MTWPDRLRAELAGRDAVVRIGAVHVSGASAIDARRLADGLPAALERALAGHGPRRASLADRVAAQILAALPMAREDGA